LAAAEPVDAVAPVFAYPLPVAVAFAVDPLAEALDEE
jgi:hypothetical protein